MTLGSDYTINAINRDFNAILNPWFCNLESIYERIGLPIN